MSTKMANRQQLYKFKGCRGLEARADKKREDSKRQRDELVMERRGVLQEIQESKTKLTDSKSGDKLTKKSSRRLEELKEWQKQRDLRKQEEKKLKPTFNRFGGIVVPKSCDSHVTLKQPKSSKDISVKAAEVPPVKDVHKPKMTTRSQNTTTTTSKTSMVNRKTTATTSKNTIATDRANTTGGKASTTTNKASTATSKASTATSKASIATSKASTTTSKASTTTSKASTATSKASTTTSKASTTTSKASTATSKASTTTSKASTTTSKPSTTTRKTNNTTIGKANTTTSKTGSAGTNKSRSTVTGVNSIVDISVSLKPKITAAKTTRVSMLVAKKSPLQDGHKAITKPNKIYTTSKSHDDHVTSNIQENTSKQSVTSDPNQHPAWIPGASLASSKSSVPNFDEAFSKPFFSPFKFTGSTTVTATSSEHIKFTFRKEVTSETLSLPVLNVIANDSLENDEKEDPLPNLDEVTTDYPSDTEPLTGNKSDVSIENINISLAHNNNFTNQQREEEDTYRIKMASLSLRSPPTLHEPPPPRNSSLNSSSGPLSSSVGSSNIASSVETEPSTENHQREIFRSYRQLHTDVVERFTSLCQEWEEKVDQFSQEDDVPADEVIDDIRTTTCQARLLMKQKLKQYLELVEMAENNSGEKKTTPEDLQGFWDMVYFQVESIDKRFAFARQLELNNWQPPMEEETVTKKPPRRSKRRASQAASAKMVKPDKSVPSERLQAARAKRDAARSRLREMKLAAAKMKETAQQEVEESKELDVSPSKVMKIEPAGSGLTPPSRQNSASSQEDVPVGNLLLLSPQTPPPQQQVFKTSKNKSTKKRHSSRSDSSQDEEIPVETILSFSLQTPPTQQFIFKTPKSKSSRKRHPSCSGSSTKKLVEPEGAFTTKLVQINASKKLIQELETDLIVSPARRSKRLVDRERDEVIVDSFLDLPEDTDFAYFPNKAI